MARSTPPTWQQPSLLAELEARRIAKGDPDETPNRTMTCPCCYYRGVPADMLTDLRGLSAALRSELPLPVDANWACDGCVSTLYREGWITPDELAEAQGAPLAALSDFAATAAALPFPAGSPARTGRAGRPAARSAAVAARDSTRARLAKWRELALSADPTPPAPPPRRGP